MRLVILYLMLHLLNGCAQMHLRTCLDRNSSYGAGFVEALGRVEQRLIDTGVLNGRGKADYEVLIARIEREEPLIDPDSLYSTVITGYDLLTAPSSFAAYIGCPRQISGSTPIVEPTAWAERQGEVGLPYLRRLIASMDERAFSKITYRAASIQAILNIIEESPQGERQYLDPGYE